MNRAQRFISRNMGRQKGKMKEPELQRGSKVTKRKTCGKKLTE